MSVERAVPFCLGLVGLVVASCGGKVAVTSSSPEGAIDAGPTCAAGTSLCDIPGLNPVVDACSQCVNRSICACGDLNAPLNWKVPKDCNLNGACNEQTQSYPESHACQVAAVSITRCMASRRTHDDCEEPYFSAYPGSVAPMGMVFALYGCAVCKSCATECAGTPDFAIVCK
jgi:hypothetical protein